MDELGMAGYIARGRSLRPRSVQLRGRAWRAVIYRVAIALGTLLIVSVLVFVGTEILPGDAAEMRLGQDATAESLAALRSQLGLDKPAPVRYFLWLKKIATLDLGVSVAGGAQVKDLVANRLSNSLLLAAATALFAIPISIALGLLSAGFPNTRFDRANTAITLSLNAIPEFFVATVLVFLFAVKLRWLPAIAYMSDSPTFLQASRSLALPVATLFFVISAQMVRMTRAAVLNEMNRPYIEMAVLKGISHTKIILRHALSNAVGPIANVVALNMAYLLSGVVIVENIFAYPGLAKLMVDGVHLRDMPVIQICAMFFCSAFVLLTLLADIATIIFNPRLRE